MRGASKRLGLALGLALVLPAGQAITASPSACSRPVYLTFDTGHMGVAPLIAEVLSRHQVPVTFFGAHEKTRDGDGSLGEHWAPWWRARAQEGHAFASHTWEHAYWRADLPEGRYRIRPSSGPQQGQNLIWSGADYCASLHRASARLQQMTGQAPLPLFRAPGGKHSPALLRTAQACGYRHVGWADAGFLGDELPSEAYPNERLLRQALERIRAGDILMAHLGIWSRQDPWAPAVLEPLIIGLKRRGLCFATLREHPDYRDWVSQRPLPARVLHSGG
ncbi:polysaccharide deacetylase family protein [Limnohabitans sp.]|jgi:peptidoglycan-N-acetylmuramic acid deacetylase|uniref:polysaccharide deacetylase family protein n=1 Tax=Limnohabitans sp. TaxID=1907725 RepID=UPI00391D048E